MYVCMGVSIYVYIRACIGIGAWLRGAHAARGYATKSLASLAISGCPSPPANDIHVSLSP